MWRNQAYLIGLDYSRQAQATNTLLSGSRPYLGWVCRSDGLNLTDTLNAGERTTLMNAIAEYHAANQDLAQRVGAELKRRADKGINDASTAQNRADSAYNSANYLERYNVDLDSYKTTGKYFVRSLTQGNTISGTDNELSIWMYLVVDAGVPERITQTAWHDQTPDKVWTRVWTGSWQAWKRQTDTKTIKNLIADPNVNTIAAGARDLLNRWKANGNGTLYIDDNSIAVKQIGANEIAAGSITTEKLAVGSSTNLWANPEFKDYGANKTMVNNGYRSGIGGKNGWWFNGNAYGSDDTMFSVCANEEYLFDFIIGYHAGNCNIGFHLYNGSRGWINQIMQPPVNYINLGSGWYRASVSIKIPGDIGSAYFARVSFWANSNSAVTIADLIVTRKNSGQLIVDGTITGDKIKANTSISAPQINGGNINIGNGNFVVDQWGNLSANSGTFRGTVLAERISGKIDVESLKSSAWMGGWRQQISFSNNFMPDLISGYSVYSNTWIYDSKSDLIPSFGGLNLNIGYKGFDIGGVILAMNVQASQNIAITQKLMLIDDQVTFHLNGTQFKSVTGGRVNVDIVWNLVKGINTLTIVVANSGWQQCSILLSGDIVNNNTVKYA